MKTEDGWRVLLNEGRGTQSRVIFSDHTRSLIDITIPSEKVDKIIRTVLSSDWNADQLVAFLNWESQSSWGDSVT
jgi:hypothetical protein